MTDSGPGDHALSSILVQSSVDGLCAVDRESRYVLWNAAMERFAGKRADEVLGRYVFDVFPFLREVGLDRAIEGALAGETVRTDGVPHPLPSGETHYFDRIYSPLRDHAGAAVGVVCVVRDVTERVLAEEALRRSEAKLRLAVEAGGVGLWRWDVERDETIWEDSLCAMFGLPPGGGPKNRAEYLALIHPDDRERAATNIRRGIGPGRWSNEMRVLRSDGVSRWVLTKGVVTTTDGGRVAYGAAIDVTEQHQRDDRDRQAQKLEAVGQLTAGIAHNFNNLLMAMIANLELARRDAGAEIAPLLRDCEGAAVRAADLVRQLMTFAGRNRPSPAKKIVAVADLVSRTVGFCRTTVDRRITLEERHEASLHARVDALQLEQALLNVLINARDALDEARTRGPRIDIAVQAVPAGADELQGREGEYVRIRVIDNGPGMDAATAARVFEPFFTTKEIGRGTGLGLATTQAIVHEHGGFVTCESEPGRGATFGLYLPRAEDDGREEPAAPSGAATSQRGASSAREGTMILVIDDEPTVRTVVGRMLETAGYAVERAASGVEALERLADPALASRVELVLLDVSMPGLSGRELRARVLAAAPRARIVYFTGFATEAVDVDDMVLEKPVSYQRLIDTVRTALDRPPAASSR
jgi:PAS domain S-box-containing protein